jgi:uncharacterized protein (TIGR00369 family)
MCSEKDYPMCFACGRENPISLRLEFKPDDADGVKAVFVPDEVHQGYNGIMHGGLITTLLDEAMVKACIMQGIEAITAEIKVRFRRAVPVGESIFIKAIIGKKKGKLIYAEASIIDQQGDILAWSEGKLIKRGENDAERGSL